MEVGIDSTMTFYIRIPFSTAECHLFTNFSDRTYKWEVRRLIAG
jgi:hypothetical protein